MSDSGTPFTIVCSHLRIASRNTPDLDVQHPATPSVRQTAYQTYLHSTCHYTTTTSTCKCDEDFSPCIEFVLPWDNHSLVVLLIPGASDPFPLGYCIIWEHVQEHCVISRWTIFCRLHASQVAQMYGQRLLCNPL